MKSHNVNLIGFFMSRLKRMKKLGLLFCVFCLVGCPMCPHMPIILVYNQTPAPIVVSGDYSGKSRLDDNPTDSLWHKQTRVLPGDTIELYPISWNYELDSLKITIKYIGDEKADSVLLFDENAISNLYELKGDSIIAIKKDETIKMQKNNYTYGTINEHAN